jgi:hypothetical protein
MRQIAPFPKWRRLSAGELDVRIDGEQFMLIREPHRYGRNDIAVPRADAIALRDALLAEFPLTERKDSAKIA